MAGKLTEISKLKQVFQLHINRVSNRSIASQLGLYKETVNKYIVLSVNVQLLLQKDDPELECLFNGGTPAYVDKHFDDFSARLPYLEKELSHKHVTRTHLWEEYIEPIYLWNLHKYTIVETLKIKALR